MGELSPVRVDSRTPAQVVKQVQDLLKIKAPAWSEVDPVTLLPLRPDEPAGVNGAILGVFARFAEIVVDRLNRVPEKNFLAFLDLLGASLLPPQPARVPLTFSLAKGSTVDALVPAGTQAAAPPAPGGSGPVVFETERPLVVTAARLDTLWNLDPSLDRFSTIPIPPPDASAPLFRGDTPIEHAIVIGDATLFGLSGLSTLNLDFVMKPNVAGPADPATVEWTADDGGVGISLGPVSDSTNGLSQSGTVVFQGLSRFPLVDVSGTASRQIVGRLRSPITPSSNRVPGSVRASRLPTLVSINVRTIADQNGLPLDAAFSNALPIDLSKDFNPFGEKPGFGDTWYFAQGQAFAMRGATVTLHIDLTNGPNSTLRSVPVAKSQGIAIAWELWDGSSWTLLRTTSSPSDPTNPRTSVDRAAVEGLTDSGTLTFQLPSAGVPSTINGVRSFWARARIVGGDYGQDATYAVSNVAPGFVFTPANFQPPLIRSARFDVKFDPEANTRPPRELSFINDFSTRRVTPDNPAIPAPSPFRPTGALSPALYLGFSLPRGRDAFPNQTLSLWFRMANVSSGSRSGQPSAGNPPRLAFESRNAGGWFALTVNDETEGFTRDGVIEFIPPADLVLTSEFGLTRYWLRIRIDQGGYLAGLEPALGQVLLNTTTATQTTTLRNETLGSSSFGKGQTFVTAKSPVLLGQRLDVREKEVPPAAELTALELEEGIVAPLTTAAPTPGGTELWVRWHEVSDFYTSGPRDRHYVMNHLTGEIRFGDGLSGMIPPAGTSNIRMASYQTGGGVVNVDVGTVVQMKTTIPYVDKVTNSGPALGGANAEDMASLIDRVPRSIRHRGRAVARQDYEDLARLVSPAVARAKCLPTKDLISDPAAKTTVPGVISVIVVPRSTVAAPTPDAALLTEIQDALDARREPGPTLRVVGPAYVPVAVTVEVSPSNIEATGVVSNAVGDAVRAFLHPLTGGADGLGWEFGERPHRSDLYRVIDSVPGVDHVLFLTLDLADGAPFREHQLIRSGPVFVSVIFETA